MKGNVGPVAAGVVIAVVVAVALFFGWRTLGPGQKVTEPVNMAKFMGKSSGGPPPNARTR